MPCADITDTAVNSESRYFVWHLGRHLNPRLGVHAINALAADPVDLITIHGYLSDTDSMTFSIGECVPIDPVVRIHNALIGYDINGSIRKDYLFKVCESEG